MNPQVSFFPGHTMFKKMLEKIFKTENPFAILFLTPPPPTRQTCLETLENNLFDTLKPEDLIFQTENGYALILQNISEPSDAARLAEKIQEATKKSCTTVITIHPEDGNNVEKILENETFAITLSNKRQSDKGFFCFLDKNLQREEDTRQEFKTELEKAIKNQEFIFHYQAQLDKTGTVKGIETLIRWYCKKLGDQISPKLLIEFAEKHDLISDITAQAIDQTCKAIGTIINAGLDPIRISANISGKDTDTSSFFQNLSTSVAKNNIPPMLLGLELSEDSIATKAKEGKIKTITILGHYLEIDDFSKGFTYLQMITNGDFSTLKIDKSLTDNIEKDEGKKVIKAIVALAHASGLIVIIEGIETLNQLEIALKLKIDLFQGFLCNRPGPLEQIIDLLRKPPGSLECWIKLADKKSATKKE